MLLHVLLYSLLAAFSRCDEATTTTSPPYKEKYFDQKLDHFNFATYQNATYKQRYLVQDDFWNAGGRKGPIFFYTGNEGAIEGFYDNCGFIVEIAGQFGGKTPTEMPTMNVTTVL